MRKASHICMHRRNIPIYEYIKLLQNNVEITVNLVKYYHLVVILNYNFFLTLTFGLIENGKLLIYKCIFNRI